MSNRSEKIQRTVLPIPDRPHVGLATYDARDPDTKYPPIEPLRPDEGLDGAAPQDVVRGGEIHQVEGVDDVRANSQRLLPLKVRRNVRIREGRSGPTLRCSHEDLSALGSDGNRPIHRGGQAARG